MALAGDASQVVRELIAAQFERCLDGGGGGASGGPDQVCVACHQAYAQADNTPRACPERVEERDWPKTEKYHTVRPLPTAAAAPASAR